MKKIIVALLTVLLTVLLTIENIDKLKKILQDTNYLYGYYEDYGLKFKANKENIMIDGNRVYIYEWQEV